MLNWLKRNKKICFLTIVGGAILVCAVLLCIFLIPKDGGEQNKDTPTLTVETPQKLSISDTDTFVLDVTVSSFGQTNPKDIHDDAETSARLGCRFNALTERAQGEQAHLQCL